ncbi:hypothetical protein EC973_002796 [Apophysomyces ossiformis]|uniref:Xylanolytic transcriptional activator regulatory domain-containing protein n=1 Tax=Apophysomyces ossiformis TaxID=679940 RepID=A0A8H7BTG2_9FUNG|nr:hypothetical protein EC973_002796 [Apophysomyces ossiformis]
MIVQNRLSAPSFPGKDKHITGRQVPIDHFLKEAFQILWRVYLTVATTHEEERDADNTTEAGDNDGSVTWKLHLSPTMMTLDTNIQTVVGLEKVLEQLSVNVRPRPPSIKPRRSVNSEQYQMHAFQQAIASALRLSSLVTVPKADMFRQFNSAQLMRHCIEAFVVCDGALFMDVPKLLTDTDMVLMNPGAAKEYPVQTLLVLSISCLMVRHVMNHKRDHPATATGLMHTYYAQAKMLLQDLFDVPHISIVQSLFILSLFPQSHVDLFSPSRTRSTLFIAAQRLALAMNLHKLDVQRGDESEQKERLRRLAWMILCADYFADWNASGGTGRIDVTDWHVDFPQPLPQERNPLQVEFFVLYCRVVMIRKMQLFRSAYMVVLQSPQALESSMDKRLFDAYMNTPDHFVLDLDAVEQKTWQKADLQPLLLYALHCNTLISTHIPFLPRRYLATLDDERGIREADLREIHQRIAQASSASQIPPSTFLSPFASSSSSLLSPLPSSLSVSSHLETEANPDLEFYCVVGCLTAAHHYTQILETLALIDPIGCQHSPVYGMLMTANVYHMIESNYQEPEVKVVCRLGLVRTLRILQHARTVYADAAVLYLERNLSRWVPSLTDEPTAVLQLKVRKHIQSLKGKARSCIRRDDSVGIKREPL